MKRWESPETRFPKVWRLCEPCSRGKRSFEVWWARAPNYAYQLAALITHIAGTFIRALRVLDVGDESDDSDATDPDMPELIGTLLNSVHDRTIMHSSFGRSCIGHA